MSKKNIALESSSFFPPVVAVVGHVDHGKTTLLDAIRKSNIAERETGGITQKIGASVIETMHENVRRKITFIDTPGHAAFFTMRSRGAKAADIGLLVVSAADGVMPQTKESIKLLMDAKIPFIVVITKSDLPEKNVEKVKQQVMAEGVMLEGLGGDTPFIEVSAKTNKNIHELLELILLVFDTHGEMFSKRSKDAPFEGIIIESKLDQRSGPKATMVVKNGTIHVRDEVIVDGDVSKVRSLINDQKKIQNEATVGDAVEMIGFSKVPKVGSTVQNSKFRIQNSELENVDKTPTQPVEKTSLHHDENALSVILVVDTLGSLEAIKHALPKEIVIALEKTGDITPDDVFLAKSTKSIIVGFNISIKNDVLQLARTEKILMKNYTIIYELLDELNDVLEGKALAMEEEIYGAAKVLASFPYEKTKVLGVVVTEGRVAKGDKVRLMRGENVIGESSIVSLRQGKNQVSKIEQKGEGGVILSPFLDFTIGDMLLCHR